MLDKFNKGNDAISFLNKIQESLKEHFTQIPQNINSNLHFKN